jgi:hypothetical protein
MTVAVAGQFRAGVAAGFTEGLLPAPARQRERHAAPPTSRSPAPNVLPTATAGRPHGGRRKGAKWKTASMWQRECQDLLRLPDEPTAALAKIQAWVDEYKKAHE